MLFGAHVSTAGGIHKSVPRALELECEAIQVFTRNQRTWSPAALKPDDVERFRTEAAEHSYLTHAVSHASYLINLCATDPETLAKSRTAFIDEIDRCHQLGIPYVCLHPGSHLGEGEPAGLEAIGESLRLALAETKHTRVHVLLENTAGQGTNLGWQLEHLRDLMRMTKSKRVGVLIDTCHLFAAGYDLCTPKAYRKTLGELDSIVGFEHIRAFHLNDSKHECGSRKDRHANLGEGEIGLAAFKKLVNEPAFSETPGLLETPGAPEGYVQDLTHLRGFRK